MKTVFPLYFFEGGNLKIQFSFVDLYKHLKAKLKDFHNNR